MTLSYTDTQIRQLALKLVSPAYWFTAGFDERSGHWFSGSGAGHEGENAKPFEAANMLVALADELQRLRAEAKQLMAQIEAESAVSSSYFDQIADLQAQVKALRWLPTDSCSNEAPIEHNNSEAQAWAIGFGDCLRIIESHRATPNEIKEAKS